MKPKKTVSKPVPKPPGKMELAKSSLPAKKGPASKAEILMVQREAEFQAARRAAITRKEQAELERAIEASLRDASRQIQ